MLKQVCLGCLVWICTAWMGCAVAQPAPSLLRVAVPPPAVMPVTGSGDSFPEPVYTAWAAAYAKDRKVVVNFLPSDSSEGFSQIKARTVDFASIDTPLSAEDVRKHKLIQFPSMAGGVVVVINLKGVFSGGLRLTGEVLVDIFLEISNSGAIRASRHSIQVFHCL